MLCISCGTITTNPKFCSRSCAAKTLNKLHPKRKTKRKCIICGSECASYRHSRCMLHRAEFKKAKIRNKTIGEYRRLPSVADKHDSWKHSHIRGLTRFWLKHLKGKPCYFCGYDKHVELCHIKAITEFPDDALLSEVNAESNVIQLCPNCHWEFDHLPRKEIKHEDVNTM